MRVLGVDPGSDKTGYGIVEVVQSRYRVLHFGVISTGSAPTYPARLKLIHEELTGMIEQFRPEYASVEDIFYAVNVKSALKLGQTRGAILLSIELAGVPVFSYTPLEIKKALVGYGRADKLQVRHMICRLLGMKVEDIKTDASDALAAAICHVHTYQTSHVLNLRGRRPANR